jgi:hypothetical protein
LTITTPAVPSMITVSSFWTFAVISCNPTTAGISMDRATMAVWEVLPPMSVANP